MTRCCLLLVLTLLTAGQAVAQKVRRVKGEYTYYAPLSQSPDEAKRIALERAKTQALADAFGTMVASISSTHVSTGGGHDDVSMLSLGGSEVRGVWLETIGEPEFSPITVANDMMCVHVTVEGRAREVTGEGIGFDARVLCNGTEDRFQNDRFRSGDDLYLKFRSPVSGHLAVYLYDEAAERVYCLLPYQRQDVASCDVQAGKDYVFFSAALAGSGAAEVDEYVMTCGGSKPEHNVIYLLFSPNRFTQANATGGSAEMPRELSYRDFQKWAARCRTRDEQMEMRLYPITIMPQE